MPGMDLHFIPPLDPIPGLEVSKSEPKIFEQNIKIETFCIHYTLFLDWRLPLTAWHSKMNMFEQNVFEIQWLTYLYLDLDQLSDKIMVQL